MKKITRIAAFLMALAIAFTMLPADAQAASNIKLNKTKLTLYTGGTATLRVSGTSRKVTFSSSRKSVATVSSKGKVTARKAGTAVITAKAGSRKMTCRVTVKKENPKLNKSRMTLYTGGTATLKVSGTSRKVTFSSSRKSVATVSSKGKITAKKAGTAIITAKAGSKKVTCKVTVKEKVPAGTTAVSIYWNGEKTIKAAGAVGLMEWESSNDSIVTVKGSGTSTAVLTGKKVGTATITAKTDGKTLKRYSVTVKMKTGPLTKQEEALMDFAVSKYEWFDTWFGNSEISDTGFTVKDLGIEWADKPENQRLWNTHKRALASAKKLLPGRDVHIIDVNSANAKWVKVKELQRRGVRYIHHPGNSIAHLHGKTEKHSVAWIE